MAQITDARSPSENRSSKVQARTAAQSVPISLSGRHDRLTSSVRSRRGLKPLLKACRTGGRDGCPASGMMNGARTGHGVHGV